MSVGFFQKSSIFGDSIWNHKNWNHNKKMVVNDYSFGNNEKKWSAPSVLWIVFLKFTHVF